MLEEVVLSQNLVYGMENPLFQMVANVDMDLIDKYKLNRNLQNYLGNVEIPLFEEVIENYSVTCHGAGNVYNTLKIFQWMLQGPEKVATFVACVGTDNLGEMIMKDASNEYLDIHYYEMDKESTGTCAVLVNNAQCTFVTRHGGIGKFDEDFFESSQNLKLLEKAKYFYMGSFFLIVGETSFVKLAKYACDNNKLFLLNLSAVYLSISYKDGLNKIVPYSDYIFCNDDEARAFAKESGYQSDSLEDVAKWIRKLPKENRKRERVVVVTCNKYDTIVATVKGITKYPVIPVNEKDIIDTSGAGDAFVGGFISQLILNKSLKECVEAGHYAANAVIRQVGCTVPDFKPNFK